MTTPSSGDTTNTVHTLLTTGEARFEAAALAAKNDLMTLMTELKALYTRTYGAVALDVHDWHWQATALKNYLTAHPLTAPPKEPTHDPVPASVPRANAPPAATPPGPSATAPGKPVAPTPAVKPAAPVAK